MDGPILHESIEWPLKSCILVTIMISIGNEFFCSERVVLPFVCSESIDHQLHSVFLNSNIMGDKGNIFSIYFLNLMHRYHLPLAAIFLT